MDPVKIETVEAARKFVKENFHKGCKCPVCEQTVKLYRRKLNSGMALTLWQMFIVEPKGNKPIHVKDLLREKSLPNTHDWTLLAHWGIIEGAGNPTGYWKVTPKGVDFIMGRLNVPDSIMMYNNKVAEIEGEVTKISFREALHNRFDLDEAMRVNNIVARRPRSRKPQLV